ncbi:MAG: hypothetical protein J6X38_00410 [Abditibacteriota bacterium]|nr:hypothetical protein [Abditibacteriota bacterium]
MGKIMKKKIIISALSLLVLGVAGFCVYKVNTAESKVPESAVVAEEPAIETPVTVEEAKPEEKKEEAKKPEEKKKTDVKPEKKPERSQTKGGKPFKGHGPAPGKGFGMSADRALMMIRFMGNERFSENLGLTSVQREKISGIINKYEETVGSLDEKVRDAGGKFRETLYSDSYSEAAAKAALDEYTKARTERDRALLREWNEIRGVLGKEGVAKLRDMPRRGRPEKN